MTSCIAEFPLLKCHDQTTGRITKVTHVTRQLIEHLLLEQVDIRVPVVPTFGKVRPCPSTIAFVDIREDGAPGESEKRTSAVSL